jgi:lipid II:glycine glycyltransferase (peptidoglycan interpeptide bridge formation enzyme)
VARTPGAALRLRRRLARLARSPRVLLVRVHDFAGSLAAAGGAPHGWRETPESCQVLDLPDDPEVLFRDAFTMQNRNKIRKAEKQGVVVRRAHDAAALAIYARLYADSAQRWGLARRLPPVFFEALAAAPSGVDVWLAELAGAPVAALLNFTWGGQIMNWGNVSRRDAWGASPNNLLHWRALQAACLDTGGPRLYNFGSSAGLPGVETFKASFGARPYAYARRERGPAWLWARRRRAARI